jgi:hypothetical protein
VLAAEHLLRLAGVDLRGEIVERARELLGNGLSGLNPLDEDVQVLGAAQQRGAELAVLLEAAAPLQQLLRGGLILPEVRSADALLYAGQFFSGACGVKDSSAGQRRGGPGPDVCEAARPGGWSWRLRRTILTDACGREKHGRREREREPRNRVADPAV